MGHAEVTALHDVIARYWWQRGYDVLNPIGWDSFGLPAENAAIRRDEHPATYTYANIETQAESFRRYGISFDWSRRLHTSDPEYYRWTQWLFLRFRERGLAYRKFSPVNWCPHDQTVLANEQVVDGMCERCGAEVTKRELSQWYFKVTDYAQRLLDDMDAAGGQLARAGADPAAQLDRPLRGCPRRLRRRGPRRAGLGLHDASRHPVRRDLLRRRGRRQAGRGAGRARAARGLRGLPRARSARPATSTGCRPTGRRPASSWGGTRPTRSTASEIPVWAADYVLADYGTGAIMAVPGQDQRDWDFAERFDLPIRRTVQPPEGFEPRRQGVHRQRPGRELRQRHGQPGRHGHRRAPSARSSTTSRSRAPARGAVNFRLRDWLLSRQRFWGCPIPIVHCARAARSRCPTTSCRWCCRTCAAPT